MGKRIFWIFILTVVAATTAAVMYFQSEHFARLAKDKIQKTVSRDLNIDLNFDRLQVGVLPPSLSMLNVDLKVLSESNPLGISKDAVFRAQRLGFSFRMIQAFSRGIAVNKVFLNDGELSLQIPKSKSNKKQKLSDLVHAPIQFNLTDELNISIRQLEVRNTKVHLRWREEGAPAAVAVENVSYLAVTPASSGTNIVANLENIGLDLPGLKEHFRAFKANADIQRDLVSVTNLDVQRKEAALHGAGKLVGSIDEIKNARSDVDLILRGPIGELADFEKSFKEISGEILADLKLVGKVGDPAVQGKLEINDFRYSLWKLDNLKANGSYGGGFLTLDSLSAEEGGGKISLKNKFELALPFQLESRAFQLQLGAVRFENFAGDLKKTVNNLKMGLDGSLAVKLDFSSGGGGPKLTGVQVKPDLQVKELELNNQVFGKQRPYNRIFMVQPFKLNGIVQWKQGEVRVVEGSLAFASGTVEAKGTITDEKGFDLRGTAETIDLGKEVGEISGLKVSGVGPAKLHVRGPGDAVAIDFDLNHKDARFDNFDFGEVAGRVTYDDKNSYILISDIKGKKNASSYEVPSGRVNVGDGDDIEINAVFPSGDPNDIFAIFAKPLADISWIPHGMGGEVSGTARVGGGYDKGLESLAIHGRIKGRNLSYQGEMLHELEAQADLENGLLKAKILHARKYETALGGDIEYKLNGGQMKYSLFAPKGKLRSLDFVTATGVPIDGLFSFHSQGQGKWETLESVSRFEMQNAFVRTLPLPPLELVYKTMPDRSEFQSRLGPNVEVSGRIGHTIRDDSHADIRVEDGNFDFLLCAVNRRVCSDPSLSFLINGSGKLKWKGGAWQAMSGGAKIQSFELSKSGYHLKTPGPVELSVQNGHVQLERTFLQGEQSKVNVNLEGRVDGSAVNARVQGEVSMRLLEFFTALMEETRGKMAINLGLSGDISDAKFNGNIDIQEGFLRLAGIDAPVDSLSGRLHFQNSRVSVDSLAGQLGGGTVQASGVVDLYLNRAPRFDLDLFFANNRVKFYPVTFAEIGDAKLSLTGDKPPYLFGGTVRMRRVMMRNNFDVSSRKSLQNARYLPEKQGGARSLYEIRIRAIAESGVFVENNLLNAEFKGEVTLLNNFEFPQLIARAELVRGKFLFRNTAFTLDHAYIRAPSPEYFNPQFSIGGVATVDNYRISLFASGTIEKPKISLTSYPAIPQEDIVSLLAFGYRGEDARKVNPNNTSAITYSEVGSILLEQLQLNQNLQSKGLRVMVAPSLNETEANIIRPNSSQTAAPKVILQTQIMKNLDAVFGGTVGSTQGQSLDAKLEYRLGRKASVSAVYEQTPAGLDATETKNSYGADLKFRWGFK